MSSLSRMQKSSLFRRLSWASAFLVVGSVGADRAKGEASVPTYHREVVRILRKNCQECHRPGQVAPFSLLNNERGKRRPAAIVSVTEAGTMPPCPASTEEGGPFRDARVMPESEITTLEAWLDGSRAGGERGAGPP